MLEAVVGKVSQDKETARRQMIRAEAEADHLREMNQGLELRCAEYKRQAEEANLINMQVVCVWAG